MDKIVASTLKVISVLFCLYLIYFLREIIFYFVLAFVFALALRPLIDSLEKYKIPRVLSGILIFLIFLGLILSVIFFLVPSLISEAQSFLQSFSIQPEKIQIFIERFNSIFPGFNLEKQIKSSFSSFFEKFVGGFLFLASNVSKTFAGLVDFVFVAIITIYFAVEKEIPRKISKFLFSGDKKKEKDFFNGWQRAENIASRWLYSYLILAFVVGGLVYIGLSFLGFKYSFLLAVVAGIFEIVPLFGPILAGIFGTILAFFQGGLSLAIWAALVFLLVQQVENFLIIPYLMKVRVDLHPVLVIVILSVGGKLFGILGAIISIPLTATIIALIKENYKDYFIERRGRGVLVKKEG